MAIKKNYKKNKKSYKKKVKTSYKKIEKVVKQTLGRQVEKKVFQTGSIIFPGQINSSLTTLSNNFICVLPGSSSMAACQYYTIGNGVGQDQRIGDEINNKGCYFYYQMIPTPYNGATNPTPAPTYVYLYFFSPKVNETGGPALLNYLSGSSSAIFFENINNAGSGLAGSFYDFTRRIDTDNYKIIAIRKHKLGFSSIPGTGSTASMYNFNNNDFSMVCSGRLKLTSPKVLKYDRLGNIKYQPVYCMIQYVRADNIPVTNQSHTPIQFTFNITQYFTDL